MISKINDAEVKYLNYFCEDEDYGNFIRFKDDNIKDMYSHNFTYIKPGVSSENILKIVNSEIEYRKKNKKNFLRIVINSNFDSNIIEKFLLKPDIEHYDYLGISTKNYNNIKEKENAKVILADNLKVNEDGRLVDIVANYQNMTLEFAIRRIDRKFQIYNDVTKQLNLYVCYDNIEPVGNCELMINDNIAKIEDFDIVGMHQRKGYGSNALKTLLKICKEKNIEDAYLVTDHDDTAKNMYVKCGFKTIGECFELMFNF